jgi:dolichol-phosphate mannosyltransferase
VAPAFNEGANVDALANAVAHVLEDQPYELVLVDDGSEDDTFDRIAELAERDSRVRGIRFSRNFGHQFALRAGLLHSNGDVVITMDSDLQHPPSLIPTLIERWAAGADVVHALREDTADVGFLKRASSRLFYRAFSLLCGVPMEPGMSDFRLLDRSVVDAYKTMREGRPFLRATFAWMGFRAEFVPYAAGPRHSGDSKYTWRKMIKLAAEGIFSFSTIPLRIGLALGVVTATLSFLELLYVFIVWLQGRTVPGWASTVGILAFLFGVLFIILGIQGQYLLRLFEIANGRPPFIIERKIPPHSSIGISLAGEAPTGNSRVRRPPKSKARAARRMK